MSAPLCVVCGSVCPDPGLWVVRGGEACSERCARQHARVSLLSASRRSVYVRNMVDLLPDHHPQCGECFRNARAAS